MKLLAKPRLILHNKGLDSIGTQWRIQRGANPAMDPIEVGNEVWPPSGAERVMIAL